jgi:hypothetical protein
MRIVFASILSFSFVAGGWGAGAPAFASLSVNQCLRSALGAPVDVPSVVLDDLEVLKRQVSSSVGTPGFSSLQLQFETRFKQKFRSITQALQGHPGPTSVKAQLWRHYAAELHRIRPSWDMSEIALKSEGHLFGGAAGYLLYLDPQGVVYVGKVETALMTNIKSHPLQHLDPDQLGLKRVQ